MFWLLNALAFVLYSSLVEFKGFKVTKVPCKNPRKMTFRGFKISYISMYYLIIIHEMKYRLEYCDKADV